MKVRCNKEKKFIIVETNDLAPLTEELSYSRLEVLTKCPYKFGIKYIDKNYPNTSSIALDLGLICHKVMELKYQGIETEKLLKYLKNGFYEDDKPLIGVDKIIEIYGFEFYEKNVKTGTSYEDKLEMFIDKFSNEKCDDDWEVIGSEVDFKILFNDKCVIQGFIDRVDKNKNTGEIRVIDYKTNSKPYEKKDLATPIQMYIYSLACKEMYGEYPVACIYDMLFLGIKQESCTKGYLDRGFKKLNSIVDSLIWYMEIGKEYMPPKSSPLCHFCEYCITNPNSDPWYNYLCEYYSLWTRENRTFKVNKEWVTPQGNNNGWE